MPPTRVAISGLAGSQRLQHDIGHGFGARRNDDGSRQREGLRAPASDRRK